MHLSRYVLHCQIQQTAFQQFLTIPQSRLVYLYNDSKPESWINQLLAVFVSYKRVQYQKHYSGFFTCRFLLIYLVFMLYKPETLTWSFQDHIPTEKWQYEHTSAKRCPHSSFYCFSVAASKSCSEQRATDVLPLLQCFNIWEISARSLSKTRKRTGGPCFSGTSIVSAKYRMQCNQKLINTSDTIASFLPSMSQESQLSLPGACEICHLQWDHMQNQKHIPMSINYALDF